MAESVAQRAGRWLFPVLVLALAAGAAWSSVWTVRQDESALVLRFGRVVRPAGPGMHLTWPWPVETLVKLSTTAFTLPIGYAERDRQRGIPPTEEQSQWLTGDTNIVELQASANYTFVDPQKFLFGVAPYSETMSQAWFVRDAVEAALTELTAGMTIDDVLSGGKVRLQLEAERRAQALVDAVGLGVRIGGVNVFEATAPATVREEFTAVQSARADRERRITEADGYARRMLPEARSVANRLVRDAESEASAIVSRAKGEAAAFSDVLAEVRRAPDLTRRRMWQDAMARILAKGKKLIYAPNADGSTVRIFLER